MSNRNTALEFLKQGHIAANDKTQPVHLQHAYQLFSSSVFVDPSLGEAWYALGSANSDLQMHLAAIAAWRRGLQCDLTPELRAKMLTNIGWRLHGMGQCEEAEEALGEAIALRPDLPAAWLNRALVHGTYGETQAAVKCMRKAVQLDPENTTAKMGLAFSLLYHGDYEEGFREFEIRFKYKLHQFLQYPYPRWNGEPDKTVFLVADQGLGDTLSFARFLPLAAKRAKFIYMVVQHELVRAFEQAFIDIPNKSIIPLASPFLAADAWSTFVSLPYALGLSSAQVRDTPQIELPVYSVNSEWKVPGDLFHIGIAYAGSPLNEIDQYRNIPCTQFLDLYKVPGVQLYSLQIGARAKDLQDTGAIGLVRDLSPWVHDIVDTAAILSRLDLVITCESALGHICAAASKECWIPYSWLGKDWRIGQRAEHRLWTPKHRLFMQDSRMRWEPVFEQIVEALRERVNELAG